MHYCRLPSMLASCLILGIASAQAATSPPPEEQPVEHEDLRPQSPLFFREVWKVHPGDPIQHAVTQANLSDPNLQLKLYGPSANEQMLSGRNDLPMHPPHIYTGLCTQTCAFALRDVHNYVDLSGYGKINVVTRESGFHQVHTILKLADGSWIVSEHGIAVGIDHHPSEFTLSESRWMGLDINRVVTVGRLIDKPDLRRVDEIGFTTLMPGSGHGYGGYADIVTIEVYGKPVPRSTGATHQP